MKVVQLVGVMCNCILTIFPVVISIFLFHIRSRNYTCKIVHTIKRILNCCYWNLCCLCADQLCLIWPCQIKCWSAWSIGLCSTHRQCSDLTMVKGFARQEEKLVRDEGEYDSYQIWGYAGKLVSLYNKTSPHKNWSEYSCNSQTYVNSGQACLLRPRSENLKKENDCFVHPLGVGLTPRINYSFMFLFFSLEVLSLIHVSRMFSFSTYYLAG